jgi:hypothetical protein
MMNLPNGEMRRMNVKQSKKWKTDDLRELGIFIAFIIIVCVLMIFSPPGFRSGRNMLNILKQTSINPTPPNGIFNRHDVCDYPPAGSIFGRFDRSAVGVMAPRICPSWGVSVDHPDPCCRCSSGHWSLVQWHRLVTYGCIRRSL